MNIQLGNLSVSQIEERLGIEFPEDIREFMKKTHQPTASNIANGKWHCFDIPFVLVCGDMDTATKIFNSVKDRSEECKESLRFALSGNN
jgi:cell wall assembly regulator SMI1